MVSYRDEYQEVLLMRAERDTSKTFTKWLEETRDLQINSFGTDPAALKGEERADYIMWNILAAKDELSEVLAESGWKPWAKERGWLNRDEFIDEIVDVMHFLANLLVTAGASGEELTSRYDGKRRTNEKRQEDGYDGVSGNCPSCDVDLKTVTLVRDNNAVLCSSCGEAVVTY